MTATTEKQIPSNVTDWIASLPNRPGWCNWQIVGRGVEEGVQNWSEFGDPQRPIGVWGNVIFAEQAEGMRASELPDDYEGGDYVNWCVYIGDCREPHKGGFVTAESAMQSAESEFPWMFAELQGALVPCEADELSATSLRNEIAENSGGTFETYRLYRPDWAERGNLIFCRREGRAGIAWGADAAWTDADSPEEALWRWEKDEMVSLEWLSLPAARGRRRRR